MENDNTPLPIISSLFLSPYNNVTKNQTREITIQIKKMGNALRLLYHHYFFDHDQPLGHHGVSSSTVGVSASALAHHLFHFEITSQVSYLTTQYPIVTFFNKQLIFYTMLMIYI